MGTARDAGWEAAWSWLAREYQRDASGRRDRPVAPVLEPEALRARLAATFDFRTPMDRPALLEEVADLLRHGNIRVTHPRYFGLFNPSVLPITVVADAMVAMYNPQLAAWTHGPAANEIERHVLRFLLGRIGFDVESSWANFTSGGQEANHTAVIVALSAAFPSFADHGLRALDGQPVLYASAQAHQSFIKAAAAVGIGRDAVRTVRVDDRLCMDVSDLTRYVEDDLARGRRPFLVVGTAGATSSGVIDPLDDLATVCGHRGLWLHVDAAWGGTALLSERLRGTLAGIDRADSVTWDAHKGMSVPLGAGMFCCRRPGPVREAFGVPLVYVAASPAGTDDPYLTTLQWTRRFIGLKVFTALAELGVEGYARLIDHQAAMGDLLRDRLRQAGWRIVNDTPLPLVCFTHPALEGDDRRVEILVDRLVTRGRAWVSHLVLPRAGRVVRACITSYETGPADLDVLVEELRLALADTA